MTDRYKSYGLVIDSDLPLFGPTTPVSSAVEADVTIRYGSLPDEEFAQAEKIGPFTWIAGADHWIKVPNLLKMRIRGGNEVVIDRVPGADEDGCRAFAVGPGIGAMLHQRGYLTLHSNAIKVGDACVLVMGDSGAGKSTLAATFWQRGYQILADDVVPLTADGMVLPGFARLKIWQDTADKLSIDTEGLRRVRPTLEKFTVPVEQVAGQGPVQLRWLYELSKDHTPDITLTPYHGMQKLKALTDNVYTQRMIRDNRARVQQMAQCSKLAPTVRIARLSRPDGAFTADALVERILADIAEPS
jgi:hypothetical protein